MSKKINLLGIVCLCWLSFAQAQTDNSPYSRYGLGDLVPAQNMVTRGMGGVSAAYYDFNTINFLNPASYARLQATTLDFGLELNNHTLRTNNPPKKFNTYSPNISYVQLGFPIKKGGGWGVNVGLRPITRVNYKIGQLSRMRAAVPGDTLDISTIYEGNGGTYEAHIGTGFSIAKGLTAGINIGYMFGSRDYTSRILPLDTVAYNYKASYEAKTSYGGLVYNAGLQYTAKLSSKSWLRLGAFGNLKHELRAKSDSTVETFEYNSNTGAVDSIDVVHRVKDLSGKITYPASFGVGVIFDRPGKWLIGVDYTQQKWSDYRVYGRKEPVQDSWNLHIGGQITPTGGKTYWSYVGYRGGFTYGKDYINVDKELSVWTISLGAGFPMRKPAYTNQFSVINTILEFGKRGNNNSIVRENFFRIGVGLSLSDIWFQKYKYD